MQLLQIIYWVRLLLQYWTISPIFSNTPSTKLSIFERDAPDIFSYTPSTKLGIFEKDLSKFD